jgi:ubiquinone/menaquinone biosynthesis C-methylase UbiE
MDQTQTTALQQSYDTVAAEYTRRMFHELEQKPLDRELLERFAARVPPGGSVGDLGCGPGHVTRFLAERGVNAHGVDLSAGMIAQARRLNPGLTFQQGNLLALAAADEAWAGIVALYSLIHVPRAEVVAALREVRRVLQPDGQLLLSFHQGTDSLHLDEWWENRVALDFCFFQTAEMCGYLAQAGFAVLEVIERPPYPEVEVQTQRTYIFARKQPDAVVEARS